jgi:hypothetical protein
VRVRRWPALEQIRGDERREGQIAQLAAPAVLEHRRVSGLAERWLDLDQLE